MNSGYSLGWVANVEKLKTGLQGRSFVRGDGRGLTGSSEDGFYQLAVDIGEAVMAALEAVGEAFVIDPQAIKDGGLQIVNVNRVLGDVEGKIISAAVGDARFYAAAGQPHRERFAVMIA